MKDWFRKLLIIVFVIISLLAFGQAIHLAIDNRNAEQKNALAQSVAGAPLITTETPATHTDVPAAETVPPETTEAVLPPDENTSYLQQLNIPALQEINPEVIGWIYIPDSQINYPLLHTNNNSTYLYASWDGEYNAAGSIFLEAQCSPALNDFNTIIYGHNMLSGSMFAELHHYRDYSYYQLHPYIYITTNDAIYRYKVFSAYVAGVGTDTYRLRFTGDEKTQALAHYINSSVWEAELTPTSEDFILTLSTCPGTGKFEFRWVVQAVQNGKWDK